MKQLKKAVLALLCAGVIAGMTACGSDGNADDNGAVQDNTTQNGTADDNGNVNDATDGTDNNNNNGALDEIGDDVKDGMDDLGDDVKDGVDDNSNTNDNVNN